MVIRFSPAFRFGKGIYSPDGFVSISFRESCRLCFHVDLGNTIFREVISGRIYPSITLKLKLNQGLINRLISWKEQSSLFFLTEDIPCLVIFSYLATQPGALQRQTMSTSHLFLSTRVRLWVVSWWYTTAWRLVFSQVWLAKLARCISFHERYRERVGSVS